VLSRHFNRYLEVFVSLCRSRTISLRKTNRHHPGRQQALDLAAYNNEQQQRRVEYRGKINYQRV